MPIQEQERAERHPFKIHLDKTKKPIANNEYLYRLMIDHIEHAELLSYKCIRSLLQFYVDEVQRKSEEYALKTCVVELIPEIEEHFHPEEQLARKKMMELVNSELIHQ